ncbi:MAG TPA: hypothetical protein VFC19_07580 [Candidatus Limnocylindrales bacterium]|nr:hypothetical protein [Candidatus Limnocylindrales bacterium]
MLETAVLGELIADAVESLVTGGALEVVADTDAHRPTVIAALKRCGFTALRSRILFEPVPWA